MQDMKMQERIYKIKYSAVHFYAFSFIG